MMRLESSTWLMCCWYGPQARALARFARERPGTQSPYTLAPSADSTLRMAFSSLSSGNLLSAYGIVRLLRARGALLYGP